MCLFGSRAAIPTDRTTTYPSHSPTAELLAGGQARSMAGEFGIALPDGYTFVRPHVRGGEGDAATPTETVVQSRGLATVMALLG